MSSRLYVELLSDLPYNIKRSQHKMYYMVGHSRQTFHSLKAENTLLSTIFHSKSISHTERLCDSNIMLSFPMVAQSFCMYNYLRVDDINSHSHRGTQAKALLPDHIKVVNVLSSIVQGFILGI